MDLSKKLKGSILNELNEENEANLIDVMARFDFHQHAIFTVEEAQKALSSIGGIEVLRTGDSVTLKINKGSEAVNGSITKEDISKTYDKYIKRINSRITPK